MQRTRSAPPTTSSNAGFASLPAELPALSVLVEEVRSPGAARPEVDALLAGLSQPLPSDASARERADLLLSLIEDAQLADYTGTDGRTVSAAAIQALLALGYPYALEVPPEALAEKARKEGTGPGPLSTWKGKLGLGLVVLAGILLFILVRISVPDFTGEEHPKEVDTNELLPIALIIGTTFLPALLMVLGHKLGKGGLQTAVKVWLILASLPLLGIGILSSGAFPFNFIPMAIGGLILAGPLLMSSHEPLE